MNARCPSCDADMSAAAGSEFIGRVRFCDESCTLAWRYRRGMLPDRRRAGTERRTRERRTVESRGMLDKRNRYGDDRRQADRRSRVSAAA